MNKDVLVPDHDVSEFVKQVSFAVAIIGHRGAGKGTFLQYLQEEGFRVGPTSKPLRNLLDQHDIESTIPNLIHYGIDLKQKHGADILIRLSLPELLANAQPGVRYRVAMDGIRDPQELLGFRNMFPHHLVVGITANTHATWEHLQRRGIEEGRVDYDSYLDYFTSLESDEYQRVESLLSMADRIIDNSNEKSYLQQAAKDLAAEIKAAV